MKKLNFGNISIELNKPLDSSEMESDDDEANSSISEKASPRKVKKEESTITVEKKFQSKDNVKGKGKESSKKPEDDSGIVRLKKYLREAGQYVLFQFNMLLYIDLSLEFSNRNPSKKLQNTMGRMQQH